VQLPTGETRISPWNSGLGISFFSQSSVRQWQDNEDAWRSQNRTNSTPQTTMNKLKKGTQLLGTRQQQQQYTNRRYNEVHDRYIISGVVLPTHARPALQSVMRITHGESSTVIPLGRSAHMEQPTTAGAISHRLKWLVQAKYI